MSGLLLYLFTTKSILEISNTLYKSNFKRQFNKIVALNSIRPSLEANGQAYHCIAKPHFIPTFFIRLSLECGLQSVLQFIQDLIFIRTVRTVKRFIYRQELSYQIVIYNLLRPGLCLRLCRKEMVFLQYFTST